MPHILSQNVPILDHVACSDMLQTLGIGGTHQLLPGRQTDTLTTKLTEYSVD